MLCLPKRVVLGCRANVRLWAQFSRSRRSCTCGKKDLKMRMILRKRFRFTICAYMIFTGGFAISTYCWLRLRARARALARTRENLTATIAIEQEVVRLLREEQWYLQGARGIPGGSVNRDDELDNVSRSISRYESDLQLMNRELNSATGIFD
jgi:hypothetical protein